MPEETVNGNGRGHFHIKEVSKKAVAHIMNTEITSGDFSSPVDL